MFISFIILFYIHIIIVIIFFSYVIYFRNIIYSPTIYKCRNLYLTDYIPDQVVENVIPIWPFPIISTHCHSPYFYRVVGVFQYCTGKVFFFVTQYYKFPLLIYDHLCFFLFCCSVNRLVGATYVILFPDKLPLFFSLHSSFFFFSSFTLLWYSMKSSFMATVGTTFLFLDTMLSYAFFLLLGPLSSGH